MSLSKEQLVDSILDRGVIVQILPSRDEFRRRLLGPKPLRFYIGADPTADTLHLSHAKNYMLLEEFRQLGHEVVVLFGDLTARIGDPTDRSSSRAGLSAEQTSANISSWKEQIRPLINFDAAVNPARLVCNSSWLASLTLEKVIELGSHLTVQRLLERDMFQQRLAAQKPIFLHEFLYPLLQGYDSVALDVNVELCGTDQIFNALVGRTLRQRLSGADKFVVAVNLMENPLTGELMSKSRGTGVFLKSTPTELFGAIMNLPDEMTRVMLINNTRVPLAEIEEILAGHPRDAKAKAAWEVVAVLHGPETADAAKANFSTQFQRKETPTEMPEVTLHRTPISLLELLRRATQGDLSNSELRRLIQSGAVKVDSQSIQDPNLSIITKGPETVLKVGKRRWIKVRWVQ